MPVHWLCCTIPRRLQLNKFHWLVPYPLLWLPLQMFKTVFKEVNVGFGSVDQLQYPTSSALYPVEQLYLQPSPVPGRVTHDADLKTTNRMSYRPR